MNVIRVRMMSVVLGEGDCNRPIQALGMDMAWSMTVIVTGIINHYWMLAGVSINSLEHANWEFVLWSVLGLGLDGVS